MHTRVHRYSDTSGPIHVHGHTTNTRKRGWGGNMEFAESSLLGSERIGRLGEKRQRSRDPVSGQLK